MSINPEEYNEMTKVASANSPKVKDFLNAFCVGGFICALGQALFLLYEFLGYSASVVKALVPMTLIVLAAVLTGFGVFDKIAKFAGAGTLVPITGFANSIVAPAMEFSREGRILGTGAKLFSIAGPVIAYGSAAASLYGCIYYFFI